MTLELLIIFVVYKNDVNPSSRYRDSVPSVRHSQGTKCVLLPAYLPGNEVENSAAKEAELHGKLSTEWALGNDARAYLLRSAFPSWHEERICRQGNKLRTAKPPVSVFAISFQFHQKGGHSCENSKQSHSLGTSLTVAESRRHFVDCVWNVMAHAQKTDFVFRRNGRVYLNRRGRQFSRLLAGEVCASAVVMLDTPCSEVVWRVLATHSILQFSLHFPSRASPCAITFLLDSTSRS